MSGHAFVAYLHFISIFGALAALASEIALFRRDINASQVIRLFWTDLSYGIFAVLIFATGALRAFYFEKGWAYYQSNPFFWAKVFTYFLIVGLSVPPTLTYFNLWRKTKSSDALTVSDTHFHIVRICLISEVICFFMIPLFAVTLARE